MPDLSTDIATQAVEPLTETTDGTTTTGRPVADLVTAQQALDLKTAVAKRRRGLSFTKFIPPGAADDNNRTYT